MGKFTWILPVAGMLLMPACKEDEPDQSESGSPALHLNTTSGQAFAMSGLWSGCRSSGGINSFHTVVFFDVGGESITSTYYLASTVCSGGPEIQDTYSVVMTKVGSVSIPWDGPGPPTGVADPINATRVLVRYPTGFPSMLDFKWVSVV